MRRQDPERLDPRVREALDSLEPVSMSETERSDLRRAVWSEITSGSPAPSPARTAWGWRFAGVAAALAMVVGVGVLVNDMGDATSEAGQDEALVATSDRGSTSVAAFERADGWDKPDRDGLFGGSQADPTRGGVDLPGPPTIEVVMRRQAELIRAGGEGLDTPTIAESGCAGEPSVEGLEHVATLEIEGTRYEAWVPLAQPIDSDTPVTFVEIASCDAVATE